MTEAQPSTRIAACPKCRLADAVRTKLIATNLALASDAGFFEPYEVTDKARFQASPMTRDGYFISALYCDTCGVGFIPDDMLPDLGIQRRTSRASLSEKHRPFDIGNPKADRF